VCHAQTCRVREVITLLDVEIPHSHIAAAMDYSFEKEPSNQVAFQKLKSAFKDFEDLFSGQGEEYFAIKRRKGFYMCADEGRYPHHFTILREFSEPPQIQVLWDSAWEEEKIDLHRIELQPWQLAIKVHGLLIFGNELKEELTILIRQDDGEGTRLRVAPMEDGDKYCKIMDYVRDSNKKPDDLRKNKRVLPRRFLGLGDEDDTGKSILIGFNKNEHSLSLAGEAGSKKGEET